MRPDFRLPSSVNDVGPSASILFQGGEIGFGWRGPWRRRRLAGGSPSGVSSSLACPLRWGVCGRAGADTSWGGASRTSSGGDSDSGESSGDESRGFWGSSTGCGVRGTVSSWRGPSRPLTASLRAGSFGVGAGDAVPDIARNRAGKRDRPRSRRQGHLAG
jgi:hypothetical protein